MQDLLFLAGWVEMGHCVPDTFILVTEKEHNSQKNESSHYVTQGEGKKTNMFELAQVFCGLLSLLSK